LLQRMLEKDPARRIASARQVGALTEAVLNGLGNGSASGRVPTACATVAVRATPAPTDAAPAGFRRESSHSGGSVRALESPERLAAPGLSRRRAGWGALLVLGACGVVWMMVAARRAIVNAPVVAQSAAYARTPPPPLALDDFEDGDTVPRDPRFAHWQRYHYNSSGPGPVHAWTSPPASGSNQSLHLAWLVQDSLNRKSDFPGAGVRTLASNVFVDLSSYSRLVFVQRYQSDAAFPRGWTAGLDKMFEKLPAQAEREAMLLKGIESCVHRRPAAFVQLFCSEYKTSFEVEFALSEDWQTVALPFSSLHEFYWKPPTNTPLASCLAVTDGMSFIVQDNQLGDGECHSGSLSLDDISFR
ncbi:MAG: hypothetical protein ABI895_43545, partial [Deltaproteobacteria bacterium]